VNDRIPAHLEAGAILRLAESQGGFGMVLSRGERDAGTVLVVTTYRGEASTLYERMPAVDGSRSYVATKYEDIENRQDFSEYLARRRHQDPDIWLIEVDIADPERFIAQLA